MLEDVPVECKNNLGTYITIPAGSKIYKNINNGLTTQGLSNFINESDGWVRDTNSYTVKVFGNPAYNIAVVSSKVVKVTNDFGRIPKLSEWHIYGNEQQGRFVTRKPESTLYYLENISNDVIAKNFFRVMDKKQYELKDHLGNVRVTFGDYKIPFNDNPSISTRGVAPFFVDEKSVMDYYAGGMAISDRSFSNNNSRYGYNSQEKSLEIDKFGNHNTAEYWEMDARILRR